MVWTPYRLSEKLTYLAPEKVSIWMPASEVLREVVIINRGLEEWAAV